MVHVAVLPAPFSPGAAMLSDLADLLWLLIPVAYLCWIGWRDWAQAFEDRAAERSKRNFGRSQT